VASKEVINSAALGGKAGGLKNSKNLFAPKTSKDKPRSHFRILEKVEFIQGDG
jgi:hypothetical protein